MLFCFSCFSLTFMTNRSLRLSDMKNTKMWKTELEFGLMTADLVFHCKCREGCQELDLYVDLVVTVNI